MRHRRRCLGEARSLFENYYQFRDDLQVFGTARCSLNVDQSLKAEAVALKAIQTYSNRVWEQLVITAPASDLTQQV